MVKGQVQLYTGDGKGKTTAAFGQALRAAGRGMSVVVIQFLKGEETGEVLAVRDGVPQITVCRFNSQGKFIWSMTDQEREVLRQETLAGFDKARQLLKEGKCDMLVLDEITWAMKYGFLSATEVAEMLLAKPDSVEIIVTGGEAPQEIIEAADLVTDMRKIKHPFDHGIKERIGIER